MSIVAAPRPRRELLQEAAGSPLERAQEIHEHIVERLLEQAKERLAKPPARFYLAKVEEAVGYSWFLMDAKEGRIKVFDKHFLVEGRGHLLGLSEKLQPRSMRPGLLDEHDEARLSDLDKMPGEGEKNAARGKCIATLYTADPVTDGRKPFEIPASGLSGKVSGRILEIHFYKGMKPEDEKLMEKVVEGKLGRSEVSLALTNMAEGRRSSEKLK